MSSALPNVSRNGSNAYVHLGDINVVKMGLNNSEIRFVDGMKTAEATLLAFSNFEFVVAAINLVEINCHIALKINNLVSESYRSPIMVILYLIGAVSVEYFNVLKSFVRTDCE